jgi:phenylacetate-CoA ligase
VGWLGRVGEAVKVRGMFLHPRQVHQAMAGVAGVSGYRFLVDRIDHKDVLSCEVVLKPGTAEDDVARAVRAQVRSGLRFDVEVRAVPVLEDETSVVVDLRTWG